MAEPLDHRLEVFALLASGIRPALREQAPLLFFREKLHGLSFRQGFCAKSAHEPLPVGETG
jgi:hypothetical protein